MKKNFTLLIFIALFSSPGFSQDTLQHASVSYSGYIDAYWAAYSDSIGVSEYQKYTTISPRSNQFGLNIAMFTARYASKDIRGVVTLHYGDIPRGGWSGTFNMIQEAYAGVRLSQKIWLDAGFFRTHVGTEALLPKENYTSSVSVATYFEPYYESGIRLNYNPSEKLSFFIYALNGYGIYEDNNKEKSGGLLVTYVFGDHLNIGYSGYYGDDSPDSIPDSHFRTYHNVFLNFKSKKVKITAGVNVAMQQHSDISDSKKAALLTSGVLIVSYNAGKKYRVYGREEFFNDPSGMLSGTFMDSQFNLTGLKIMGGTIGVEYKPTENSYIRLEGRSLIADKNQKIFYDDNYMKNNRQEIMLNMGFWFE